MNSWRQNDWWLGLIFLGVLLVVAGTLADIAPTILELMHLKKPASMTGKSLIQKS